MEINIHYTKDRDEYMELIKEYQKNGLLPEGEAPFQKPNYPIRIDEKYMLYLIEKRESSAIGGCHWQRLINALDDLDRISHELWNVRWLYHLADIGIKVYDRFIKRIDETNSEAVALFICQNKEKSDYEIFEGVERILDELQKEE